MDSCEAVLVADQGKWFKLWCSAGDDPDLANLSLEDFGRWCKMGMYLKLHGSLGSVLVQAPAYALQQQFRVSSYEEVVNTLRRFPHCNVSNGEGQNTVTSVTNVTVTWSNWMKYQGDFSGDRVRKMRAMKRSKRRGEEKRGEEKRITEATNVASSAALVPSTAAKEWPESDLWILNFLETQTLVNLPPAHLNALQNPDFWERTSEACGGIDLVLLQAEFAKIGNWLTDNPSRVPTAKGIRRFVSGWLERAYERERRYGGQGKAARR